jgi:hypothetical protein
MLNTFNNCYLGMLYRRWLGLGKGELDTCRCRSGWFGRLRRRCRRDVGLAEVIACEQQRRATVFRHGVRKAVGEVELRRMPAPLAVSRKGGECRLRLPDGDEKPNGGPRCADLRMVRLHPVLIVAARNYAFAFLLIRWPRREDCNRPLR